MSNLQDIIVKEMKVKPEIDSKVKFVASFNLLKVIYKRILLLSHWY